MKTCLQCAVAFIPARPSQKLCGNSCRHKWVGKTRVGNPIHGTVSDFLSRGELDSALATIKSNTEMVDGCWKWKGRTWKNGYAYLHGGHGWPNSAHRVVLQMTVGRPLNSHDAAHHVCANRACVNPDHLQLVTSASNMAEMLARKAYIGRIHELEEALREASPGHPLLGGNND